MPDSIDGPIFANGRPQCATCGFGRGGPTATSAGGRGRVSPGWHRIPGDPKLICPVAWRSSTPLGLGRPHAVGQELLQEHADGAGAEDLLHGASMSRAQGRGVQPLSTQGAPLLGVQPLRHLRRVDGRCHLATPSPIPSPSSHPSLPPNSPSLHALPIPLPYHIYPLPTYPMHRRAQGELVGGEVGWWACGWPVGVRLAGGGAAPGRFRRSQCARVGQRPAGKKVRAS